MSLLHQCACDLPACSREYPEKFGQKIQRTLPHLKSTGEGKPEIPEGANVNAESIFASVQWGDMWNDGKMKDVIR